ncbi:MAG TPA: NFACT RNA binding domain-containing protein [Clostridia bacterium]|nr:NFACT RNA binding domain-containing protein [Clostridia bacterium]
MPFDGIVTKSIVEELTAKLVGGRIEKVFQPEADEIVLLVRAWNKNCRLVLSASPNYPRIHLTEAVKENPSAPPVFCMLLRKHLSGGKILSFEFNDYERIIGIVVESANELGDISQKCLIIEIMGRYSNIILVNSEDKIIDSIKHVDSDISSVREVMPARPYILPPAQDKLSPDTLDVGLLSDGLHSSTQTVDKYLLDKVKGFSPLLCRETCFRAGIENRTAAASLAEDAVQSLKTALLSVLDEIRDSSYEPCVIFEDEARQKPLDFHCLGIRQYPFLEKPGSISEVLDAFYSSKDNAERMRQKKSDLYKVLNNAIERCSKKLAIQEETLRDVADRDKLKLYGELITANIYRIQRNTKSVPLQNYYSENGEEYVEVPLDPNLSPQENAQRYFKKYSKAKSTFTYTTRQLEDSRQELDYLESVLQLLDNCTVLKEMDEVRQELAEQGYMQLHRKLSSKKQQALSEPLHFVSSDGFDIYVGKNNKQNDQLTLKLAQSNDVWLHTKNIPGSHVIIRKVGREIPDRTVEEAAALAAWHSKARMSANVQVDYTAVRNVSKPSGAKPGKVIYVNYVTAVVTPDKNLVEKLKK